MVLSKVVELPEFKKQDIVVIGHYTTDAVFAVLARRGEKVLPVPTLFYLVENGPAKPDPEIYEEEIASILRHFGYFGPVSTFPPKSK
jgi:hypothetical protein